MIDLLTTYFYDCTVELMVITGMLVRYNWLRACSSPHRHACGAGSWLLGTSNVLLVKGL